MKKLGLFGLSVPIQYGGLESDEKTISLVKRELAAGWLSLVALLGSHLNVCYYLDVYGTADQKVKYLTKLASGEFIACHANNEVNGKTVPNLETSLTKVNDYQWLLSGRKEWITNSRHADVFAISSKVCDESANITQAVIILERSKPGLSQLDDWKRMGSTGVSVAPVIMKDITIERHEVIGEMQFEGRDMLSSAQNAHMFCSSARAIGASRRLIEQCIDYLNTREREHVVGEMSQNLVIKNRLGQLLTKFTVAQNNLDHTLDMFEKKQCNPQQISACRVFCLDVSKEICLTVQQLFGGHGYTSKYGIERQIRDLLSLSIIHTCPDILYERIAQAGLKHTLFEKNEGLVLKYAQYVPEYKIEHLKRASLNEIEKVVYGGKYKDVDLYLHDGTTQSPSGTFKDLLGCLTFAHCLQNNINLFCCQSSGNTAMSFITYAAHTNIQMILFYPLKNSYKINQKKVTKNVTLIEVDAPETKLKEILARFSKLTGIPIMPNLDIQFKGNSLRSYYLQDYQKEKGITFDWYSQSLSSAFGPIGMYQGFGQIQNQSEKKIKFPKFLGIQQEAVHPYAKAVGDVPEEVKQEATMLEPTLFRTVPTENLINKVKDILDNYGGKVTAILNDDFFKYKPKALQILTKYGIELTWVQTQEGDKLLEKAGLIALAATLWQIDQGYIQKGEKVLVGITGGCRTPGKQPIIPNFKLNIDVSDDELAILYNDIKNLNNERNQIKIEQHYASSQQVLKLKEYAKGYRKCVGIAKNYFTNSLRENPDMKLPNEPIIFQKPLSSLNFDNRLFQISDTTAERGQLFHEVELAVLLKKGGKNLSKNEWMNDYIEGYFLCIDYTDKQKSLQAKEQGLPWTFAKGQDNFLVLSEFIPREKIRDIGQIELQLKVNEELRQQDLVQNMHFNVFEQLEYISKHMTLNQGDIIMTGSPEGSQAVLVNDVLEANLIYEGQVLAKIYQKIQGQE